MRGDESGEIDVGQGGEWFEGSEFGDHGFMLNPDHLFGNGEMAGAVAGGSVVVRVRMTATRTTRAMSGCGAHGGCFLDLPAPRLFLRMDIAA